MQPLFACPCGQKFAVPPSASAQQVRCPRCSRLLAIPATQRAAAPVERPAPPARSSSRRVWLTLTLVLVLATGTGIFLANYGFKSKDSPGEVRHEEKPPPGKEPTKPPAKDPPSTTGLDKPPPDIRIPKPPPLAPDGT